MRGASVVADALAAAGVRTVFALSGNQIMPIFDACIDAGIRLIHVRHEAAAVYMAEARAQLSGEVGVVLVTAAPGFANGLSPVYSARASESPLVLLSGDAPLSQEGRGAFQELKQIEVSAHLVKAAIRSRESLHLGDDVARAIRIARSGRPGPVHLALPFDLLNAEIETTGSLSTQKFEIEQTPPDPGAAENIIRKLAAAKHPVVLTGPALNASRSGALLERFAAALDAPVIPMESPRGLRDPALGNLSQALPKVDVALCLGKTIDFILGFGKPPAFAPDCKFIVVDPEDDMLERARRVLGVNLITEVKADAATAAGALIEAATRPANPRSQWRSEVSEAIASRSHSDAEVSSSGRILPASLCRAVQQLLDAAEDPILICDGGEFGQWAQACLTAPTRIINGPAGAIGGGLCYAIAAKIHRPDATVVALMGDGTVGFHLSEFETALRCDAPVIAIVGHDARWNAEYQIQLRDYGIDRLIGCELDDTRYDLAAAGLGCHGEHVTHRDQLAGAFERALGSGLPACINVRIEGLAAPTGSGH